MTKIQTKIFIALLFIISFTVETKAQYDLTFTVDTGIRVVNANVPEIGHDTINNLYYLFYILNSGTNMRATSADGLTFGTGNTYSTYEFHPLRCLLPNGQWRRYVYDEGLVQLKSLISNDGISFTSESGSRYAPVDNDNSSFGIYDIYKMPDNSINMFYVADLPGLNNVRKAVSLDSGYTFNRVETNSLADSGVVLSNPGSSYVDNTTISIGANKRRLICMRGGYGIYSFTSIDYGDNYIFDDILFTRDEASAATGLTILGMFDPAMVLLDDGRYRIYFCANYFVDTVLTYSVFSATSEFPNTGVTSINSIDANISIYPNPSNGKFTIDITDSKWTSIEVFDELGKKVLQTEIKNSKSIIDISNQSKGAYFIKIYNGINTYTKKVILW